MYRGMADMGLDLNGFITLASMVQWEAADPGDKIKVAAVFLNRIGNPDFPLLQSDVTERYANQSIRPYYEMGGANAARYVELMMLFNTYVTPGLPPGPVNNPGMAAMRAVLDAPNANYTYLFFCSNIETGEMFFAHTVQQHEANEILAGLRAPDGTPLF